MIISVSRRTDIPAFYMEWFLNRLSAGYVYVRNPMNSKQVSQVSLKKEDVSCFVFWTKNPECILKYHNQIHSPYFVQLTITPYLTDLEQNINNKRTIIDKTIKLSKLIPGRIIWRYDPIVINEKYTIAYHLNYFEKLCSYLQGSIRYCVISFIELYSKIKKIPSLQMTLSENEKIEFLTQLVDTAKKHDIQIKMCSSTHDYEHLGIEVSQCIDEMILSEIGVFGYEKDKNQRQACQCIVSADIGSYNTCDHGCIYCYANKNHEKAHDFLSSFDMTLNILGPKLEGDERISTKIIDRSTQLKLF